MIWNGTANNDMANAGNYTGTGTRTWNGTQAGDLSLTASAVVSGTFNYLAAQTGSVTVNGGGNTFVNDINSTFLMEAGAGAVTWSNVTFQQGPAAGPSRTFTFRNNSVNDLTFASSVSWTRLGTVAATNGRNLTFEGTGVIRVEGSIANMGNAATITKRSSGVLVLSGTSSHLGLMALNDGTLRVGNNAALGSSVFTINAGTLASDSSTARTLTNAITMGGDVQLGDATGTGALTFSNINLGTAMRTFTVSNTTTVVGAITNTGGLTKAGSGTLTLAASNSYTGATVVTNGVLNLNSASGSALGSTSSVSVTNATLLISQSDQVSDSAAVTLSGGTIQRGSGVSEGFARLTLTTGSFLDFSGGTAGTVTFSGLNYTPSALLALDIANFNQGSMLVFQTTNNLSMTGFTFSGTGGFGSSSFNGSTFTITAIPEPSTYLAAAGLLAVLLWPSRRLLKGARTLPRANSRESGA
jgi:autotransporter-associated beta strand protein